MRFVVKNIPLLLQTLIEILQVVDDKGGAAGRGHYSRVVRLECHLDVVRRRQRVIYLQADQHRGNSTALGDTSPHIATCGCG